MMEVAVDERRVARMHRRVDLLGLTHEVVVPGVVEPARHVVTDPAEWTPALGGSPELFRGRDRDAHRLVLRER